MTNHIMNKLGHNNPPLDPKETILSNIQRKKPILDREPQFYNNIPIPSWIELSLIDVCNRSCSFCPKSDELIAPNTYQKMERILIDKLSNDLHEINFKGAFCLCGYGEPLLFKDIDYLIEKLGDFGGIEIITNGDTLTQEKLVDLYNSKVTRILISLYDGEEQMIKFKNMIVNSKIPNDFVILRDRWYSDKKDYGVKLTNRAGTISVGNQPDVKDYKKKECYYPSYQLLIDWDGNIYLCPQDWHRKMPMGNIMQKKIFDIWNGPMMSKYRNRLLKGERDLNPCNNCNAEGTVYGSKHAESWKNYLKK